jgi:predicted restriction endonuclease
LISDVEKRLNDYLIHKRHRDQKPVRELKKIYNQSCQICGEPVVFLGNTERGIAYSEVCHIKPHAIGAIDDQSNMIVLCPNHHIMFDLGIITLDPADGLTILHIDQTNPLHKRKVVLMKHRVSIENIKYHYEMIYLQTLQYLYGDDHNQNNG